MQHVDVLSRAPVQGIKISDWSTNELKDLQDLDNDLITVKGWIIRQNKPNVRPTDCASFLASLYKSLDSLLLKDGLLFKKWVDDTGLQRVQIVVPPFLSNKY